MAGKVMDTKDEKHFIFSLGKAMENFRKRFFYLKASHAWPVANSAKNTQKGEWLDVWRFPISVLGLTQKRDRFFGFRKKYEFFCLGWIGISEGFSLTKLPLKTLEAWEIVKMRQKVN